MAALIGNKARGLNSTGGSLGKNRGLYTKSESDVFIFDLFNSGSYSGYSVRKLSSTYTGNCIRVRRDSDDAEQDIGFSGTTINTTALTSFVGANNGYVVTWYDQGNYGNNITTASALNQPQIISGGTIITENSIPTVDFDGALHALDGVSSPPTLLNVSQWTVFRQDVSGQDCVVCSISDGVNRFNNGLRGNSHGTRMVYGGSNINSSQTFTDTTKLYSGSGIALSNIDNSEYLNGVAGGGTVGVRQSNLVGLSVGSRVGNVSFFNGKISETLIWYSDQTSNRSDIEIDISNFYSL